MRFGKAARILRRREFLAVQQRGLRLYAGKLVVLALDAGGKRPRIGITVPGKVANAVIRNRIKRWVREAFRSVAADLPPAEAAAGRVAAGKIGTTVEEKVPAAVPGRDQLKVSPQVGKGAALSPAAEEVVARDQALKEAQTRIGELEKTLKDLQRAIDLKNQTMAQLQTQSDASKAKAPAAAPAVVPPVAAPGAAAT